MNSQVQLDAQLEDLLRAWRDEAGQRFAREYMAPILENHAELSEIDTKLTEILSRAPR